MIPQDVAVSSPPGALLPIEPGAWTGLGISTAKRVDVQSPPPGVEGLDVQTVRGAVLVNVAEHALHALFMKLLVLSKRDEVLQQARMIQRGTAVVYPYGGPVGLPGHRAQGS